MILENLNCYNKNNKLSQLLVISFNENSKIMSFALFLQIHKVLTILSLIRLSSIQLFVI